MEASWGYGEADGPAHWAELDPDFATCGNGHAQSPIDLPSGDELSDIGMVEVRYQKTRLDITNTGRGLVLQCDRGSSLVMGDRQYELEQFHFHVPGEHRIDGVEFAMEAHLVHRAADHTVVVAVLFCRDAGAEPDSSTAVTRTPLLDAIWQDMPGKGMKVSLSATVTVADLLPADGHYLTYDGSLTTPPCCQGVRWLVLTTPQIVGGHHLDKFGALVGSNNRPMQPLNNRKVQSGYAHAPGTR